MDAALPSTDLQRATPPLVSTGAKGYAVTVGGLLLAVGVLLGVRRLSGGLATPLSPAALLMTMIVAVSLASIARIEFAQWLWVAGFARIQLRGSTRKSLNSCESSYILLGVSVVGLLLLAASLSIPGTHPAALAGMWILVLAAIAMPLVAEVRRWKRGRVSRAIKRPLRLSLPPIPLEASEDSDNEETSDEVFQQMQRGMTDDGHDFCHGWVRTRFEPRQRVASIHLAFCPPMLIVPEMHVDQVDGPESQIKIAQLLPYGVRIELRLSQAHDEATSTRVEFSAVVAPCEAPIAGT